MDDLSASFNLCQTGTSSQNKDEGLVRSRTSTQEYTNRLNTLDNQRRTRSNIYSLSRFSNRSFSSENLQDAIHTIPEKPEEEEEEKSGSEQVSSFMRNGSGLNTRVRSGWGEELISIGGSKNVDVKKENHISSEAEMLSECENEAIEMARGESVLPHAAVATAIDESFSSNYRAAHAVLSSWKNRTDQGTPVENFENAAAQLLKRSMDEFDNETLSASGIKGLASPYRLSIRSKLQEKIEADIKHLFKIHSELSEMASLQVFNEALVINSFDIFSGDNRNKSIDASYMNEIGHSSSDSEKIKDNEEEKKEEETRNVSKTQDTKKEGNQTRDEVVTTATSNHDVQRTQPERVKFEDSAKVSNGEQRKKRRQKVKKVTLLKGLQRKEVKKISDNKRGLFQRTKSL